MNGILVRIVAVLVIGWISSAHCSSGSDEPDVPDVPPPPDWASAAFTFFGVPSADQQAECWASSIFGPLWALQIRDPASKCPSSLNLMQWYSNNKNNVSPSTGTSTTTVSATTTTTASGDVDSDGLWDSDDTCPNDPDNDVDSDGVCAAVDSCPDDPENDGDGDGICDGRDSCPDDPENDGDGDGICDGRDSCPYDPDNDMDSDAVCADVDSCPDDPENDLDRDDECTPTDPCPLDPAVTSVNYFEGTTTCNAYSSNDTKGATCCVVQNHGGATTSTAYDCATGIGYVFPGSTCDGLIDVGAQKNNIAALCAGSFSGIDVATEEGCASISGSNPNCVYHNNSHLVSLPEGASYCTDSQWIGPVAPESLFTGAMSVRQDSSRCCKVTSYVDSATNTTKYKSSSQTCQGSSSIFSSTSDLDEPSLCLEPPTISWTSSGVAECDASQIDTARTTYLDDRSCPTLTAANSTEWETIVTQVWLEAGNTFDVAEYILQFYQPACCVTIFDPAESKTPYEPWTNIESEGITFPASIGYDCTIGVVVTYSDNDVPCGGGIVSVLPLDEGFCENNALNTKEECQYFVDDAGINQCKVASEPDEQGLAAYGGPGIVASMRCAIVNFFEHEYDDIFSLDWELPDLDSDGVAIDPNVLCELGNELCAATVGQLSIICLLAAVVTSWSCSL